MKLSANSPAPRGNPAPGAWHRLKCTLTCLPLCAAFARDRYGVIGAAAAGGPATASASQRSIELSSAEPAPGAWELPWNLHLNWLTQPDGLLRVPLGLGRPLSRFRLCGYQSEPATRARTSRGGGAWVRLLRPRRQTRPYYSVPAISLADRRPRLLQPSHH
jgi:hypothetical protein